MFEAAEARVSQLIVERRGHVLEVTMNRPEARNAFGLEMLAKMSDAWDELDEDPELRVAILTGGGGHFSAGADLKLMHSDQKDDPYQKRFEENPNLHWRALLRNPRPKKPIIAAVEGVAVGGGTEILQGTDIRIGAEGAVFGVTEVKWGLFPLGGSTVRLRRQIPYAKAIDLLLTGRTLDAEEADRIGLITRVVPRGEALAEARKVAEVVAGNGPLAVQAIRRSAIESDGLTEADALANELKIGWPIFQTEDAKEGPRAFQEKRKPQFKGK
jgi:enoyl-CoA hydratase